MTFSLPSPLSLLLSADDYNDDDDHDDDNDADNET